MKRKWHTIFCLVSLLGVFLLSGCAGQENAQILLLKGEFT